VLSTSNNQFTYQHYIIVGVWLVSIVVAAKYFMQQRAIQFDPNELLTNINEQVLLSTILSTEVTTKLPPKTLFHISNTECKCNLVTEDHMNSIFSFAKSHDFTIEKIPLTKAMQNVVPSVPAVLVTDEEGALLYFGPYGQGISCSASNGIIDMVLQNFLNGFKFSSVHNKATGCYCNLS